MVPVMSAPHIEIRPFEEQDRARVMSMSTRLLTGVATWRDRAAAEQAVRSWVADSLDAADPAKRPVVVAVADETVVGFVTVGTRPHWAGEVDAYVGELIVDEQATGHGVGRALMAAAEGWARDAGHRRLSIETGAANVVARDFYAALGYADEEVVLSREL